MYIFLCAMGCSEKPYKFDLLQLGVILNRHIAKLNFPDFQNIKFNRNPFTRFGDETETNGRRYDRHIPYTRSLRALQMKRASVQRWLVRHCSPWLCMECGNSRGWTRKPSHMNRHHSMNV